MTIPPVDTKVIDEDINVTSKIIIWFSGRLKWTRFRGERCIHNKTLISIEIGELSDISTVSSPAQIC